MNPAQAHQTQSQQNATSSQSPSKEPAHETGRADAGKMARDFERNPSADTTPDARIARNPDPLPDIDPAARSNAHPDPVAAARSRIISVDTSGTGASDSTVDTDGKSREARRHQGLRRDHQVHSNAVLDEHVPTPPEGLGGIDSRSEGNLLRLALQPGWHIVDLGSTSETGLNGARGVRRFRLERHDTAGEPVISVAGTAPPSDPTED